MNLLDISLLVRPSILYKHALNALDLLWREYRKLVVI